jgi:cell division protein FtsW
MKQQYDRWLLLIVFLLIFIGLLAVYSSTSVINPQTLEKFSKKGQSISSFMYLKKQLFTVFIGMIAMFVTYKTPIQILKKIAIPLLIVSFISVLLVFTPLGIEANGARRWIKIGPSPFQPSEFVKLSMIFFLAWYMSTPFYNKDKLQIFLIPVFVMGIIQLIFIKQPDFGALMSLEILTLSMLFLSGIKLRYLLSLTILALPIIIKLASEPYRLKRIIAFLDPWKDPQGSGFQLIQSFIALGSGGLTGVGLGEGKQKLSFLPEVHTDFIFAHLGEELGFVTAFFVILLFILLFIRGILISKKQQDPFCYYLSYGISLMLAIQAVINFAVVTGMVPTKGLPLPFISYGGSSLLISMTSVGILLNLSRSDNNLQVSEIRERKVYLRLPKKGLRFKGAG